MTREEIEAIRGIIREEIAPIKEDVKAVKVDLEAVKGDLETIKGDLEAVKVDTEITRGAVNALVDWADNVAVITGQRFPVNKAE